QFGSLVSEEFYHGYSYFTTSFACVSNSYLIYILIVTHVNHVGPYRWLLLSFAVVDVLVSLVHFAVIPGIHVVEFGYIFWGYRLLHLTTAQGIWISLVFVLLFYQTFVLLAFHYIYRFVMLCRPPWLAWIERNPWRNWLAIAGLTDIIFVGGIFASVLYGFAPSKMSRAAFAPVLQQAYGIDLLADDEPGYLGIVYW
ncbi:hypothetical protein PFISCL1PPCAC_12956, partial [Pristionchus fissidentatus]